MNALPPITPSDASRIRRAALALLRRNRRVASHPLDGRPLRYSCPSPGHYPFQWFWDSCFHAVALAHPEPDAAREELELLVSTQRPDGFLPHVNFWERRRLAGPGLYWAWMQSRSWGFPRTSALIQPPVLAIALERYVEITGDRSLVALLRPRVERYFAFLARERSPGPTGLLAIVAPWESGMDHSPIYDGALRLPYPARPRDLVLRPRLLDMANRRLGNDPRRLNRHGRFLVQDVLVNAVYADGLRSLARLQRTVLQDGAGADSDARAARVEAAILAQLRGDDGFFYPRDLRTGTLLPVRTVAGLMPLLAGSFSADDLRPLLTSLDDPQGFSTPFPAPSVAVAEPAFTPGPLSWRVGPLIWRGPSWINTNWLLRRALLRRGDERRADRLARSSAALVLHSGFHEYFNPLTGSGHGAPGFSWGTLVVDMLP